MGIGSGIGQYRYEGWDLATKHAWMQHGTGAAAAFDPHATVASLAATLNGSDDVLRRAMAKATIDWEGATATAASTTLACYADTAMQASEVGATGASTVDIYGGSFANLKPKIAAPTVEGTNSIWGTLVDHMGGQAQPMLTAAGVQSDYTKRIAANKAADTAANQALYDHEKTAQAALAGFPTSDTPPAPQPNTAAAASGQPGTMARRPSRGGTGAAGSAASSSASTTPAATVHPAGGGDTRPGASQPPTPTYTANSEWTPRHPPDPGTGAGAGGPIGAGRIRSILPDGADSVLVPNPITTPGTTPNRYALARPTGRSSSGYASEVWNPAARSGPLEPEPEPSSGPAATRSNPEPGTPGRPGMGGMPSMGGTGARANRDRTHRNNVYLPSDEPFVVEFDGVTPPVIGLPGQHPADWR
jgi:hypothetical protein